MRLLKSFLIILLLGMTSVLSAQNLQDIDFENIRVDNLSDQQIRQIYEEARSRNLSIEQVQQLATTRGMPRGEVQKLGQRLREARSSVGDREEGVRETGRMRTVPPDTARARFFDRFFDADTQRDSVELYQTIEEIKFRTEQSSEQLSRNKLRDKIFGFELFSSKKSTFEPSMNIPTPENYQLGPGDELLVDIWGAAQNSYQLQISPEGTVMIDRLGPIALTGLTIEEARVRLREKLSELYSGLSPQTEGPTDTYFQVTLGQVRTIQVTVLGEAVAPGSYAISSLSTVFNALYNAGGPNVNGSFRKIDVIRGDSLAATFDLYNLLIHGNQNNNIRLRDQDIIKINPYINRVDVQGEIKRPGFYETENSETLADLINFTGGFTGEAYTQRVKVYGNTPTEKKISDISRSNFDSFKISNGDSVAVGKILDRFENLVEIRGAVFREGEYQLEDTSTVASLIERADGLRPDVFVNRGLIYREQDDLTLEAIPFNVTDVVNDPEKDIALQKNDIIIISSIFDMREDFFVEITGPVQNPDQYQYAENMTLKDLIFQAGGFREQAAPFQIEVARRIKDLESREISSRVAEIFMFEVDESLKLDEEDADFELNPFDKVYIRTLPNYQRQNEIKIVGEVKYPGTYSISRKDDRISDMIQRAGGLTPEAYRPGATLFRQREFTEQEAQQQDVANVEGLSAEELETQTTRRKGSAQIGINLPEILRDPGSKYDLFVERGDSLFIPKQLQTVTVEGGVFFPTTVRYQEGFSYRDYITQAGGFTDLAKEKRAYVIYANGEVDRAKKILFFKNFPKIKPGATLVVPEEEEPRELTPQERIGIWSAIVSTAAVIATAIGQITN